MIRHQGIKQSDKETNAGLYVILFQGIYKVGYAPCKCTHLEKCIQGKGDQHTARQGKPEIIDKPDQEGMHPGVVIAVRDKAQHLFKLIDAVWGHDAGILVKEIREPAEHTKQECAQAGVF